MCDRCLLSLTHQTKGVRSKDLMPFFCFCMMVNKLLNYCKTALGKRISLGIGVFWCARLIIQFFGYSSRLWKGKTFETTVHIVLALFWTYLTIVFVTPYIM
jgi:hypothetical protein